MPSLYHDTFPCIYISLYPQNYGRLKVLYKNNTNNKPLNLGINCSIQLLKKKKTKHTKRIFRVQYSICTEDKNIIALAQTHIANI